MRSCVGTVSFPSATGTRLAKAICQRWLDADGVSHTTHGASASPSGLL